MSLTIACLAVAAWLQEPQDSYVREMESYRAEVAADLMREDGWLAVVGLFWLEPGENSMGCSEDSDICLPAHAPKSLGKLLYSDSKVYAKLDPEAGARIGDRAFSEGFLRPDVESPDDRVVVGSLRFQIVKREDKVGVRLWDSQTKARTEFKGLDWYQIDPRYRMEAVFRAHETPRTMDILNVIGQTYQVPNPGYVEFQMDGESCRLEAQSAGEGLFFNFKDATSGKGTYAAGRFLDAEGPKGGVVILDFNRATNPPCAYTDFATCPLPPKSNELKVAILAGERTFRH